MHVSAHFMHGSYFHACSMHVSCIEYTFMHGSYAFPCMNILSYFHSEYTFMHTFMRVPRMEHARKYKTCVTDNTCMKFYHS